jgi:glycerophosphoryl diester phosphodiesterase
VIDGGACKDANGDGRVNDADRVLMQPTAVIADAHAAGLLVHAYTFRNEPRRLASDFAGKPENEVLAFFAAGVDGLFTDFPDTAVAARVLHRLKTEPDFLRCLVDDRCRR